MLPRLRYIPQISQVSPPNAPSKYISKALRLIFCFDFFYYFHLFHIDVSNNMFSTNHVNEYQLLFPMYRIVWICFNVESHILFAIIVLFIKKTCLAFYVFKVIIITNVMKACLMHICQSNKHH